jgi:Mn-containing catalase
VDHPAARALTGYLLVRGGVHQVAYTRALELLTRVDLSRAFPMPRLGERPHPGIGARVRPSRAETAV